MLRELTVQNLALIEDIRVQLHPGFCGWTGETGAGKSLLLTSLNLVLGGKASADLVRTGKPEAFASAVFVLERSQRLQAIEALLRVPLKTGELILTRRVFANGRSTAQVNDLSVSIATLRELGDLLLDLHGQHENRVLLDPDCLRDWLDAFGRHEKELAAYKSARARHDELRRRRLELLANAGQRERELALLQFERDELAALDPRAGEVEDLTREAHRLANIEGLRSAAKEGYTLLYEADRSAQGLLEKVARRLESLGAAAPEFATAAGDLGRLADEAREIAYALRRLGQSFDDDPRRLDQIETRLAAYRKLAARLRCPADELERRKIEVESRLAAIERDDTDLNSLLQPLTNAWDELKRKAAALTEVRTKSAQKFARLVQSRLKPLSLEEARLSLVIEAQPLGDDPTASPRPEAGADRVELLFAANPGESPKPLRKTASGGELSRVTLAIKAVLARTERVPTLVFDEIDTGVGGRLGAVLGQTLAELARSHQVICVTHLPQIASFAEHQWVIRKRTERGRTKTTITYLTESERIDELAAMLRGDSAAEGTRKEAKDMLIEARSKR